MKIKTLSAVALLIVLAGACGGDNTGDRNGKKITEKAPVIPPVFNADSAYAFVQAQVDFGPRVPGTEEHKKCGEYLSNKLEEFGAVVFLQEDKVKIYDGSLLPMKNIIGQFQPDKEKRLILFAHWDTRPWADKDSTDARWKEPIDGANDGASGVGVLLEVARLISQDPPDFGIDIIFFDVEDYGTPEFWKGESNYESWCLGSQYWSKNPHVEGYWAKYGILLDMVGAKNATFAKEGTSMELASNVVRKIFKSAKETGNMSYFDTKITNPTIDDHLFVNQYAKIPSAAIVEFYNDVKTMGMGNYGSYHHTHMDNMDIIDAKTLEAVGETVLYTIYNE